MFVGNGHASLIRCGSAARLRPARPASGPGARGAGGVFDAPAGRPDVVAEDSAVTLLGLPRRRRSEEEVGEPVPVGLDVRMTAAAEHDEQFVGERLERGGQEEQEVPASTRRKSRARWGGSTEASSKTRASRADRCSAGHRKSCPPCARMNCAASAVAVTRMAVPGS